MLADAKRSMESPMTMDVESRVPPEASTAVVVCSVTASFVPYASLLLDRIVQLYSGRNIVFHVLASGCDASQQGAFETLRRRRKPTVALVWHHREVDVHATPRAVFEALCLDRLRFLDEPALDSGRALMLDVDLLVESDLLPLWQTDLCGRMLGAVRDFGFPTHGSRFASAERPGRPYFNAGVLLVDVCTWKRRRGLQACLAAWPDPAAEETVFAPDQDAINRGLTDDWHELDPSWNAQVIALQHHSQWAESSFKESLRTRLQELRRDPYIRHWAGPFKPWTMQPGCDIPFQGRYLRLLASHQRRMKLAAGWDNCRRFVARRRFA
jgi:lipopolysaccharide biosynthesis glycosyltransferase